MSLTFDDLGSSKQKKWRKKCLKVTQILKEDPATLLPELHFSLFHPIWNITTYIFQHYSECKILSNVDF